MWSYGFKLVLLMVLALCVVWKEYQVISTGRETETLRKKTLLLQHENNKLQFECQRLEEPSRLLHLNKTLLLHLQVAPQSFSPGKIPSPK
jgi:cell division protein FtsL